MTERLFEPLPGKRSASHNPRRQQMWTPLLPVPRNAPAPPNAHYKHGTPARIETYRGASGAVLGFVCRFELADDGKEFMPLTYCEHGPGGRREWRWKSWSVPRPLYGLDHLAAQPEAPIIICEGEKAADAAAKLLPNYVVMTSPGGSNSAGKADWTPLAQRQVVIWPDADEPGRKYATAAARALTAVAATVLFAAPPIESVRGWDAADALAEGWDTDRALALVESALPSELPPDTTDHGNNGKPATSTGRQRVSQSTNLIDLTDDTDLWHCPDRDGYATIPTNGHCENWPLRSKGFKLWLTGRYFERHDSAPGAQAFEDALRVLEARAIHSGPEYPIFTRVGEYRGAVYLDLGNEKWQAVRITSDGWDVVEKPPIKFLRSTAMRPLPRPEPGGSIETLRDYVNVSSEADFKLVVGWLVGALRPRGPYPILAVNGEQGSGKSCLSRLCRSIIDPNVAPIRSAPRDEQSLLVAARNSLVIALDNLSDMPGWLSDSLCRLSTGGGFSTRALYSDWEEIILQAERPILLNGIPDLAARADLVDRSIHVVLPALPEGERRSEDAFWAEFEVERPFILGALLDGVSCALRNAHANPGSGHSMRMMDFADWVRAAEPAFGWSVGTFISAYAGNREGAVETAIEQDPMGEALRKLVDEGDFEGSATELLAVLEKHVSEAVRKSRSWPAANKLRGRLRRIQSPLRSFGIELELDQRASGKDRTRLIGIRKSDRLDAG